MNDTSVLDLDISDVLITPEPFPDVAEELARYAKEQKRGMSLATLIKIGKIRIPQGKRPHRADGTKYTSVPTAQRKVATRSKSKIQKDSRQKNRVK